MDDDPAASAAFNHQMASYIFTCACLSAICSSTLPFPFDSFSSTFSSNAPSTSWAGVCLTWPLCLSVTSYPRFRFLFLPLSLPAPRVIRLPSERTPGFIGRFNLGPDNINGLLIFDLDTEVICNVFKPPWNFRI